LSLLAVANRRTTHTSKQKYLQQRSDEISRRLSLFSPHLHHLTSFKTVDRLMAVRERMGIVLAEIVRTRFAEAGELR
jgi:hypothetical protein